MSRNRLEPEESGRDFTFIIVVTFISFLTTFAGAIISLIVYLDLRTDGNPCECIERDLGILFERLTEVIEQRCGAPSAG